MNIDAGPEQSENSTSTPVRTRSLCATRCVRSLSPHCLFFDPRLQAITSQVEYTEYSMPNLIMTYTGLLALAILRDDFSRLDRVGLIAFLRACQNADGRCVFLMSHAH